MEKPKKLAQIEQFNDCQSTRVKKVFILFLLLTWDKRKNYLVQKISLKKPFPVYNNPLLDSEREREDRLGSKSGD